jgi:hypothetical protein
VTEKPKDIDATPVFFVISLSLLYWGRDIAWSGRIPLNPHRLADGRESRSTVLFAFDCDRRQSGKTEFTCCCRCYVDDAATHEWPAVVDRHHNRVPAGAFEPHVEAPTWVIYGEDPFKHDHYTGAGAAPLSLPS